jgi:hypothetical protein
LTRFSPFMAVLLTFLPFSAHSQLYQGWAADRTAVASCSAICTSAGLTTTGASHVAVQATGTGVSMTFGFQGSVDGGVTWQTLPGVVPATGSSVTSATANGIWVVSVAGFGRMRVNLTAISSGTETFTLEATTR